MKRAVATTKIMLQHADYRTKVLCWDLYVKPLFMYGSTCWFDWTIIDLLNEEYANYFSHCVPNNGDKVPLSPGQEIVLKNLKLLRTKFIHDGCTSLAGARTSLTSFTRQASKKWLFLDKKVNFHYPELPLIWAMQPYWNSVCSAELASVSQLFDFVTSSVAQPRVAGSQLREQLSAGTLKSKRSKRLNYLRRHNLI